MLLANTIRLLALVLGAVLSAFLGLLFARKWSSAAAVRPVVCALAALGVWQLVNAAALYRLALSEAGGTGPVLDGAETAALGILPALVLHVARLWSGRRVSAFAAVYATVPFATWALASGRAEIYRLWFAAALTGAALLCLLPGAPTLPRRFLITFGASLAVVAGAGGLAGAGSATFALASVIPLLTLAWWIYRVHLFGLLIRPRLVFAIKVGFVFAVYMVLVWAVSRIAEVEFGIFEPLLELAFIVAAAMIWLPLYGWMSRFLTERTTLYAAFSRALIEKAARILDLGDRVQFLAEEVGRTFGLRRVLLLGGARGVPYGYFAVPPAGAPGYDSLRDTLFQAVESARPGIVNSADRAHPGIRGQLAAAGFNYLFPLWYEDRLNGLLLIDTSPRLYLDLDESILEGLSAQISQSLEAGRAIEQKIALERKLAHHEQLASLGRAAASIAHEVRNPLSSIKTLTQLMREDPEVERRYSRDLGFILSEVDRLNRTVQQLLSFARPLSSRPEAIDLSETLETTAGVLAREHAAAGIAIERGIEPALTLINVSREGLQQIVLNLLLNAVQASGAGSAVRLEALRIDGRAAISVTDSGPGIAADVLPHIFEPFFTTRHKGTGLGLAIVHKNVDEMGGEIRVESPIANGRGTRVTVTLPCE